MVIETIIARYGLIGVLLGAGLEGETVVVAAGLLAHQGLLPLPGVAVAGAIGSFIADQLLFLLGRRFRDHPRVRRVSERAAFKRALSLLEARPEGFIFAFRFIYGIRTVSPIAIGTSAVSAGTYLVINVIAAIVWAILFTAIGYAFGHAIERLFGELRSIEHVAIAIAVVFAIMAFAVWYLRRRMKERIKEEG
ncbi:MAG: DedA family protein [Rhodobiaceae bacterium]|nr:DedA family protein [Rhodobiaceae bacterium]MCC0057301.1 DedA family protein [Rhodobiaceae bacterium]